VVTRRGTLAGDADSLVLSLHPAGYSMVKHLLSADSRPDRDEWIGTLNAALTNLRAWGGAKYN
jgi:hypothetical protein